MRELIYLGLVLVAGFVFILFILAGCASTRQDDGGAWTLAVGKKLHQQETAHGPRK